MLQLYDASKEASAWLEFYMESNSDAELEKYKKAIHNQFFGRNDWPKDPSFRECNKLITSFSRLIPDPNAIADTQLITESATTIFLHKGFINIRRTFDMERCLAVAKLLKSLGIVESYQCFFRD